MSQFPLSLRGCAPIPLAHYLKALGILRLVAEQADPAAAGCWQRDVFILHTRLDRDGLLDFFLHHYQPTPILAPWNGGSGFYASDNREALRALGETQSARLSGFAEAITDARGVLARHLARLRRSPGYQQALCQPAGKKRKDAIKKVLNQEKPALLLGSRDHVDERVLSWLDAAFVLTSDGAKYPPLLGTGGNDGRLEFTNNFMQRLMEIIDPTTGSPIPDATRLLQAALFGMTGSLPLSRGPVGQFFPGSAGGANATTGFAGESAVNPWDFILMLEGAVMFAAAAVRRLESAEPGVMACPFCVRPVGAGYASAAAGDELAARAEMWMPLWERPVQLPELAAILAEGRSRVGARAARTGVDFARAVVSLGVDRGLAAFQRYGFQVRNGLAYFATPLGRFAVRRNARADLLSEADRWLDNFRRIAGPSNDQVPAGITRTLNQLENRILDLCQEGTSPRLQAVLVALGQAEKALARSLAWTTGRNDKPPRQKIAPLAGLSGRWLSDADDGSDEFRLAAALASVNGIYKDKEGRPTSLPLRCHLEPVVVRAAQERHWFAWNDTPSNDVVWHEGDLLDVLNAIFARRLLRAQQAGHSVLPDRAVCFAPLADVVAFLEGRTDDDRLAELLWGLSLVDWSAVRNADFQSAVSRVSNPPQSEALETCDAPSVPSALFSLLRLAFLRPGERGDLPEVPAIPMIHCHAAVGHGLEASRLAVRRLRGCELHPALSEVAVSGTAARRAAAALLFPLSRRDFARLGELVLKPQTETQAHP
jgi:CRISPR-associated protein Csx17